MLQSGGEGNPTATTMCPSNRNMTLVPIKQMDIHIQKVLLDTPYALKPSQTFKKCKHALY